VGFFSPAVLFDLFNRIFGRFVTSLTRGVQNARKEKTNHGTRSRQKKTF
jgi:hypothetical protein